MEKIVTPKKARYDILWEKIEYFDIDDPTAPLSFSARLARDHFWEEDYARSVIKEYKKFIYLIATSDEILTPSLDVDEAWHLHLSYTRSYWDELCGDIVGRPLHHDPTEGGPEAAQHFQDCYRRTLERYRMVFEMAPPPDIWPDVDDRFAEVRGYRTVSLDRYWMFKRYFPPFVGKIISALFFVFSILLFLSVGHWLAPTNNVVSVLSLFAGFFLVSRAYDFMTLGKPPIVIAAEFSLNPGSTQGEVSVGTGCGGCGGCGG